MVIKGVKVSFIAKEKEERTREGRRGEEEIKEEGGGGTKKTKEDRKEFN